MEFAVWCIVWLLIGIAVGISNGRAGACALWCLLLGPIGLVIACCLKSTKELDKKKTKKCPHCAERVLIGAKVCKHCGHSVASFLCPSCKTRFFKPEEAIAGGVVPCPKCATAIQL